MEEFLSFYLAVVLSWDTKFPGLHEITSRLPLLPCFRWLQKITTEIRFGAASLDKPTFTLLKSKTP